MDNIPISNLFILKNDKLIFIYDFLNYWTFFIELHEVGEFINDGSNYIVINSVGEVPKEAPTNIFNVSDKMSETDFDDNQID